MAKRTSRSKPQPGRRKKAAKKAAQKPARMSAEKFYDAKQAALERTLGKMDGTVLHAIIPFAIGGGLDLYTFSKCIPGVVYATQELIEHKPSDRTKESTLGHFELVACVPASKKKEKSGKKSEDPQTSLVSALLNPIAGYAFQASLNPGETAEIPDDEDGPAQCVIFAEFDGGKELFQFAGERFGLLLCIRVLPQELKFARKKGVPALVEKLKAAGVYPYSIMDRKPVV